MDYGLDIRYSELDSQEWPRKRETWVVTSDIFFGPTYRFKKSIGKICSLKEKKKKKSIYFNHAT